MIGRTLGHYRILDKLGEGGMGAVYRACDTTLGRDVALKILPPDVVADPDRLERFRREARAVAALNHPNMVTIYSVEQADGVPFLTMELVTGTPLDRVIAVRPVPIARVMEIAVSLADALAVAHDKGIVHRDLKPANIMVSDSGRVKVLDFGLAKMSSDAPTPRADVSTNLVTTAGAVLGTPAYMSPEQVSGVGVDHRTDIFSLGTLLYELATGVRPFRGASPAELASSILRDEPRPAAEIRPSVPASLARVVARCLEKQAVLRYATMSEVLAALKDDDAPASAARAIGPSVAVLPFQNLSADPQNEFFSGGLAEEILNAWTRAWTPGDAPKPCPAVTAIPWGRPSSPMPTRGDGPKPEASTRVCSRSPRGSTSHARCWQMPRPRWVSSTARSSSPIRPATNGTARNSSSRDRFPRPGGCAAIRDSST
jgi:non-specific serine/threonine protein kinase